MEKASEFQVGDVVWDVIYGKGVVTDVADSNDYPIEVTFRDKENEWESFTADGKRYFSYPRTLFFSEPKIEGAVVRPFTPTLEGKTVVIYSSGFPEGVLRVVKKETEDKVYFGDDGGDFHHKSAISEIREVGSENIFKK
jgi:hypothetical protein